MKILKGYIVQVFHVTCNHPDTSSISFDVAIEMELRTSKEEVLKEISILIPNYYHTFDVSADFIIDGRIYHKEWNDNFN